ncbi:unnamed protein product, partial [Dovyalis caffra]
MKNLGHLSYFHELEVSSHDIGYYLSQAKYATNLLTRANLIVGMAIQHVSSSPRHAPPCLGW